MFGKLKIVDSYQSLGLQDVALYQHSYVLQRRPGIQVTDVNVAFSYAAAVVGLGLDECNRTTTPA